MSISGGCLCGAVRFRIEAEPVTARTCWCRDCRYIAAGNATVNVVFPSADFHIEGETGDYVSVADSGAVMHRKFCRRCGTPVYSHAESRPHLVVVRAGTLDDPGVVQLQATIWTGSAPPWAQVNPDLPAFDAQPPAPPPPTP